MKTIFRRVILAAAVVLAAYYAVGFAGEKEAGVKSEGVIVTGANITGPARIIVDRYKPPFTFESIKPAPAPDYSSQDAWEALPGRKDGADLAPSNTRYPEAQDSAKADVFYIHPTCTRSDKYWNAPVDDEEVKKVFSIVSAYTASAFNAAAKVYAPRYRQATLYAFFDDKTASGVEAIRLAYSDVERAFLYYLEHYNQGRPFILASHSQGSLHAMRLLQEHIIGKPCEGRMVAAYLIGYSVPEEMLARMRGAGDKLITWTTCTAGADPSFFTKNVVIWMDGAYRRIDGRKLVQINPLSWIRNGPAVAAAENPGSLPFVELPAGSFKLIPGTVGADASGEVLLINKPEGKEFALEPDDFPVLNAVYGDYHNYDYPLFYESIRRNAVGRVNNYKGL